MSASFRALTAVVVAHNDAATLTATVDRIYRALMITVEEFKIIVFDDGSTDDTPRIAEALRHQYSSLEVIRNEQQRGLGYCTIAGSKQAITPFIVYIPADNTWPLRSFVELFGHIGKADVVTSYAPNLLASMSLAKRFVSRSYSFILNTLFGRKTTYYNGLTIYPVAYLRRAPIGTSGFGFQAEALIKAISAGYSFLELRLPVDTVNVSRARSVTLVNTLNAAGTILRLVFELYVLRRAKAFRTKTPSMVGTGQSADDLGTGETRVNREAGGIQFSRGPLRIVIVGASSGIGATLALALAQDGHQVCACARRKDRLLELATQSSSIRVYVCDVSDEGQVKDFFRKLARELEGIDVLINCAGTFGEIGPIETSDSASWRHTIEVNLFGTYAAIKHALPLLKIGRQPRIINFAGGGAFSPFANYSAYACSKTAVVRLTECLSDELSPLGICINAVAPGFIATELHEATLAAGETRAGRMQFGRTRAILEQGGAPMENVVDCVRALISPAMDGLSGKSISSNFDPWQTSTFQDYVDEISRSDLYTLRRINIVNLPEGHLRSSLSHPWTNVPGKKR